jgi:hypothetical protein
MRRDRDLRPCDSGGQVILRTWCSTQRALQPRGVRSVEASAFR